MRRTTSDPPGLTVSVTTDATTGAYEIHPDVVDGDRVVHKTATGARRKDLRREASVISQMDSPRVVRFLELVETDTATDLVTGDAGSRTLADPTKIGPLELVRALRDCVAGVRELHASGWEHGGLEPAHVIVGARGRIKFCSLGRASRLAPVPDGETGQRRGEGHTGDVTALVRLVAEVGSSEITHGSWRDRRERRRLNRKIAAASASAKDVLRTTGSPLEVLTHLDGLLAELGEPGGTRRLDRFVGAATTPPPRSGRLRKVGLITGATLIGVLALASATTNRAYGTTESSVNPSAPATPVDTPRSDMPPVDPRPYGPGRQPGSIPPTTKGSIPSEHRAHDRTDDTTDTPPEATFDVEDNVVTVDGTRYRVGRPGDVVTVGEWKCDRTTAVALLRPTTGEVFVFDRWARPDTPASGRLIGVHRGALGFEPGTTRCNSLVVVMADGSTVDVPLGDVATTGEEGDHPDPVSTPGGHEDGTLS